MATYTLLLTQAPLAGCSHYLALDFANALIERGHQLKSIFFYQEATYVALNGQTSIQGQTPLATEWLDFTQKHNIELQVCIANAIRRGLVDAQEQQRYQCPSTTLTDGFNLVGLGEIAIAYKESDHVIQF